MIIPTYVVIPFKDEPLLTAKVLLDLHEQGGFTRMLAYDNGSRPETLAYLPRFEGLSILSCPGQGIYTMWNLGWDEALEEVPSGPVNIAFLNNDITIPPRFLGTMSDFLRSDDNTWVVYPDYNRSISDGVSEKLFLRPTQGTYQHGGMSGWAFMLKGEAAHSGLDHVDEQFEWWYGDDDLVRKVAAAGKNVSRIVGLPLDHINEATARNGENEWTHQAKERDTQRFREKWT